MINIFYKNWWILISFYQISVNYKDCVIKYIIESVVTIYLLCLMQSQSKNDVNNSFIFVKLFILLLLLLFEK